MEYMMADFYESAHKKCVRSYRKSSKQFSFVMVESLCLQSREQCYGYSKSQVQNSVMDTKNMVASDTS